MSDAARTGRSEPHSKPGTPPQQAAPRGGAIVYIDGGARGNPGPAGYGVRVEDANGELLDELHGALGIATNNVAEYNGLLAALRYAVEHGYREVHVRADSELLVKQMRGEYRVKNAGLKPLFLEACALVRQIGHVTFTHVRREENKEADRLSNLAMDESEKSEGKS